jgi:hypothetical protein
MGTSSSQQMAVGWLVGSFIHSILDKCLQNEHTHFENFAKVEEEINKIEHICTKCCYVQDNVVKEPQRWINKT